MTSGIRIRGLAKHYGRVHALDGLDLTVEEGQVHGFLGPNGAGKSTTIRILLGLARKTDDNAGAPLSAARAHETADFLRYLAERMPQLAVEWRAGRAAPGPAADDRGAAAG